MADQHLEMWLEKNRKRFRAATISLVWHALYAAYSGNGGRPNDLFESAVKRLGYAVRPTAEGGYIFGRVTGAE